MPITQELIEEFFKACKKGDVNIVKQYIEMDENIVRTKNNWGESPLHVALNKNLVKVLCHNGANPNVKDNDNVSPLGRYIELYYSQSNNLLQNLPSELIKAIFKNSQYPVNVNSSEKGGMTLLHMAIAETHIKLENSQVNGCEINEEAFLRLSSTARLQDIEECQDIVKVLCKNGADVNAFDEDRKIPLHYVVNFGEVSIVEELCQYGADIYLAQNGVGSTPIEAAEEYCYDEVVATLLYYQESQGGKLVGTDIPDVKGDDNC